MSASGGSSRRPLTAGAREPRLDKDTVLDDGCSACGPAACPVDELCEPHSVYRHRASPYHTPVFLLRVTNSVFLFSFFLISLLSHMQLHFLVLRCTPCRKCEWTSTMSIEGNRQSSRRLACAIKGGHFVCKLSRDHSRTNHSNA